MLYTILQETIFYSTIFIVNEGIWFGAWCKRGYFWSRTKQAEDGFVICCLSQDHKPNRPDEQQRIEALGGVVDLYGVWRVFCPSQVFFGGGLVK